MKKKSETSIIAYTDGSCKPNPGIGGWGWVAYFHNTDWKLPIRFQGWGGSDFSTNQKMELEAFIQFIVFCPYGLKVKIYSDSEYLLKGINCSF
jgi:ribonuclease HI